MRTFPIPKKWTKQQVRALRDFKRWSNPDLRRQIGCGRNQVSRWEMGDAKISMRFQRALDEACAA